MVAKRYHRHVALPTAECEVRRKHVPYDRSWSLANGMQECRRMRSATRIEQ